MTAQGGDLFDQGRINVARFKIAKENHHLESRPHQLNRSMAELPARQRRALEFRSFLGQQGRRSGGTKALTAAGIDEWRLRIEKLHEA